MARKKRCFWLAAVVFVAIVIAAVLFLTGKEKEMPGGTLVKYSREAENIE